MKERTGKIVWIDFFNGSCHFEGQRQNIIGCSILWKASGRTQNAENKDLEPTPFRQSFQERATFIADEQDKNTSWHASLDGQIKIYRSVHSVAYSCLLPAITEVTVHVYLCESYYSEATI